MTFWKLWKALDDVVEKYNEDWEVDIVVNGKIIELDDIQIINTTKIKGTVTINILEKEKK